MENSEKKSTRENAVKAQSTCQKILVFWWIKFSVAGRVDPAIDQHGKEARSPRDF